MTALRVRKRPVFALKCERCGFEWETLTKPERCASRTCRSPYWNDPRGTLPRGRPKGKGGAGK